MYVQRHKEEILFTFNKEKILSSDRIFMQKYKFHSRNYRVTGQFLNPGVTFRDRFYNYS